jgi:SPP1 gp7 family putative phage head morphogenesis protein
MAKHYQYKKPTLESTPEIQNPGIKLFNESLRSDTTSFEDYNLRPYNPDELWQKKGNYDIYDDMREDDQISALLTLKKFFILNGEFTIESDNEDVKEFLEYNFKLFYQGFFEKSLYEILSALDYGFSITEKIFKLQDIPNFGKKIILHKLKTRAPHAFEFDQDEFGNITKIRQDTQMRTDIEVDPDKIIHYIYQPEFQNPYGKSELNLGVYRAYWSKVAIIKFWNIYLERFGSPTAIGTYPRGDIQHKDDLKRVIKNIQQKTGIVVPEGVTVELLQASKEGAGFEKAIDKYNTMIARKMLIPDLMGMSGSETGGGSFALGRSQFDMFYNNIQHERENLQRVINKEIIYPLVFWNFGSNVYARIRFKQTDGERKENDLRIWLDAVKSGKIPLTDTHINWFMNQVNAPEIEQKELDQIKEQKEEMREAIQNGQSNKGNDEGMAEDNKGRTEKEEEDREDEKEEPEEKKQSKQYATYYRELTKAEKRTPLNQIQKDTARLTDLMIMNLSSSYKLVVNGLIDDIKRKKIVERKRIEEIKKLDLRHGARIEKSMVAFMKESHQAGRKSVEKKNFINQPIPDEELIKIFEEFAFNSRSFEYASILKNTRNILTEAIRNGEGIREVVKQLEQALKGYDVSYSLDSYEKTIKPIMQENGFTTVDELFANIQKLPIEQQELLARFIIPQGTKLGANRLEAIARTTISTAYNEARRQEYQKLQNIGEIQAYQFSAILDGRTSDICRQLDQKIFPATDENLSLYNPPLHYMCRSLMLPIFIDETLDEFSIDGQNEFTDKNTPPPVEKTEGNFLRLVKEQ